MRVVDKSTWRAWLAVLAACALALVASPAAAQDKAKPPASDEDRAVTIFEESAQRYREGKFKEAVDLLNEACRLSSEPALLYNLGRAYEGLGDLERARDAYQRYLDADPKAADRGAIEQRIATLTRQLDERAALQRQRDAAAKRTDAPPPAAKERPASPVPWIVAAVGGAGLATGAVFGILTVTTHNDARDEPEQRKAADLQSRADTFATIANISFIAGAVIAAGGLTWGLVDVVARPGSSTAGLVVRVRGAF